MSTSKARAKPARKKQTKKKAARKTPSRKKAATKKPRAAGKAKVAKKKSAPVRKAKTAATKRSRPVAAGAKKKLKARVKKKGARKPRGLTPREREHFRELLLQRHRELTQAYAISKGDSRSRLDDGTEDYIDYAVSSYAREFLLSLSELDRKHLLLVEDALKRIDRGSYGRCQHCGKPIIRKRLEAAPWAENCLRCQEMEEQGLLGEGRGGDDEDSDFDELDYDDEDFDEDDEEEAGDDEDESAEDEASSDDEDDDLSED